MSWVARVVLISALAVPSWPAAAQQETNPGLDLFAPGLVAPTEDFGTTAAPDDLADPIPYAPKQPKISVPMPEGEHALTLEARLMEGGVPLADGVTWRVFGVRAGDDGELPLLVTARGGSAAITLTPGDYLVHAAFGRAGATKRVTVAGDDQIESLVLDAGGLKLGAVVGEDEPVGSDRLTFEILQENAGGDLVTVVPKATPGLVLRLSAGTYHVISRYGAVNAVVRADIEVEAGKLTEAIMRHAGAEVTLKLVSAEGGEALANTSWTVLTEAGATVHQSVGAFPSLILAEGSYTAVADHQSKIYSRDFTVEPGVDRDIEVRLSDFVPSFDEPGVGPLEVRGEPMEP